MCKSVSGPIFGFLFGTFIGSTSRYRFYTISDSTKRYYVDDSRGQYRYHPILFPPLSSTIDYLSTETFQFHVESTVWDYWKEDLLTMFCYFAPVIKHSVQTMCTMFLERTSLGCLAVCSEFPPEKPTLNLDV